MISKNVLYFSNPINFHDVCTVYPVTISQYIEHDSDYWDKLLLPFAISHDYLGDEFNNYSMFDIVISTNDLFKQLVDSLKVFCHAESLEFKEDGIHINGSENSLNSENFDELSNLFLDMLQREKIKREEIPHFESEDGKRRWLNLQKRKQEYEARNKNNNFGVMEMINCVQHGGNSYIPDDEILKWTFWRLSKVLETIMIKNNWDNTYRIFLVCGDSKLINTHWTQSIKL